MGLTDQVAAKFDRNFHVNAKSKQKNCSIHNLILRIGQYHDGKYRSFFVSINHQKPTTNIWDYFALSALIFATASFLPFDSAAQTSHQSSEVVAEQAQEKPGLTIIKDQPVSVQISSFAQKNGWSLLWEANEYASPVGILIFGDTETVIAYFLDGARNAGVPLSGVIHRQIKTIQITE